MRPSCQPLGEVYAALPVTVAGNGERAAPADRRRRLAGPHAAGRLDRRPAAAPCRRPPPGDPSVGPAAPLPPATPGGDVHGAAERVLRPGRDRCRPLRRDRPDPDAGPHRLRGLARGPYRDGDRRLLVRPLRQRPPRSGPGPPSPYAGDADPAGGVGDRRCGRGRRDAADVPRDARRPVPRCSPRPASSASSPVSPRSPRSATSSPGCRSPSATWCASATRWWWTASGARSTRSP